MWLKSVFDRNRTKTDLRCGCMFSPEMYMRKQQLYSCPSTAWTIRLDPIGQWPRQERRQNCDYTNISWNTETFARDGSVSLKINVVPRAVWMGCDRVFAAWMHALNSVASHSCKVLQSFGNIKGSKSFSIFSHKQLHHTDNARQSNNRT